MKALNSNFQSIFKSENTDLFKRYLALFRILEFYSYEMSWYTNKQKKDFEAIDKKFREKLNYDINQRILRMQEGININQSFLNEIINHYRPCPDIYKSFHPKEIEDLSYEMLDSIHGEVFYYLTRDWTDQRKKYTDEQYDPILKEVDKYLNSDNLNKHQLNNKNILVPGAGLCKLAYDLAQKGFNVDCNDMSIFNYFVTDFLLTKAKINEFSIVPNFNVFSDCLSEEVPFTKLLFPYFQPNINSDGCGDMYYTIGDFTKCYNGPEKNNLYDAVVTVYFIDSAKNIIEYIDIIHRVLKPGGVWINLGPPTFDWEWMHKDPNIKLPWNIQKEIMKNYGFEIVREEKMSRNYTNIEGMMKTSMNLCVFFTAIKK